MAISFIFLELNPRFTFRVFFFSFHKNVWRLKSQRNYHIILSINGIDENIKVQPYLASSLRICMVFKIIPYTFSLSPIQLLESKPSIRSIRSIETVSTGLSGESTSTILSVESVLIILWTRTVLVALSWITLKEIRCQLTYETRRLLRIESPIRTSASATLICYPDMSWTRLRLGLGLLPMAFVHSVQFDRIRRSQAPSLAHLVHWSLFAREKYDTTICGMEYARYIIIKWSARILQIQWKSE